MKSIIASGLLLGMAHGAAIAGPYVNIENNSGFSGSDFVGTSTDYHLGFEGESGSVGYYIQGGATTFAPDGASAETLLPARLVLLSKPLKNFRSMVSCLLRLMTPIPMVPRQV